MGSQVFAEITSKGLKVLQDDTEIRDCGFTLPHTEEKVRRVAFIGLEFFQDGEVLVIQGKDAIRAKLKGK